MEQTACLINEMTKAQRVQFAQGPITCSENTDSLIMPNIPTPKILFPPISHTCHFNRKPSFPSME